MIGGSGAIDASGATATCGSTGAVGSGATSAFEAPDSRTRLVIGRSAEAISDAAAGAPVGSSTVKTAGVPAAGGSAAIAGAAAADAAAGGAACTEARPRKLAGGVPVLRRMRPLS